MHCNQKVSILATVVVTVVGLFSLFLKGQYKVREHNLTAWNAYRLFEGVVFANIPVGSLLFFLVPKLVLVKFLGLNILTIFVVLAIYRACFHYYLFNFKKVKRVLIVNKLKTDFFIIITKLFKSYNDKNHEEMPIPY